MEVYQTSSKEAAEQLINVVVPRVRSIVNEWAGQESSTSKSFMSGGTAVASTVKMDYHLEDEAYELAQIHKVYMTWL